MSSAASYRVPFWLSVIMNINVMIGAGLFVNPSPLTALAGSFGCLSYSIIALILLPLVLSVAAISQVYPAAQGGLYSYIRAGMGKTLGLISIGFYFVAKSISSAILLGTTVFYLQNAFPLLAPYSPAPFKLFILGLLCSANMLGLRFGSFLQLMFMILKTIPIVLVILCAYTLFNPLNFTVQDWSLPAFTSSLPIALYTLIGFETCCSIGHVIEGGGRYLARVVVTSFLIVAAIATLFQLSLFGGLGMSLATTKAPMTAYFAHVVNNDSTLSAFLGMFVSLCIMLSVLGACYGILHANNWNAFVLMQDLDLPKRFSFFEKKNSYGIPLASLLLQCSLTAFFALSGLSIITLTRLTVLGVVFCYSLVTCSLLASYTKSKSIFIPPWVGYISFASCFYIAFTCFKDLL